MSRTKAIGGYAEVRVNGDSMLFRGDMTHNFQTHIKEGIVGRDRRHHGFIEKPNLAYIEGDYTFDGKYTTAQLEAIVDATVTARLADGRVLVLRGAYIAGELPVNVDEAKGKIRFEGEAGEELAAQS